MNVCDHRMEKMNQIRILAVEEGMPFPPSTGGTQAIFNSLKLLQHHVELHLILVSSGFNKSHQTLLEKELNRVKINYIDLNNRDKYEIVNALCTKVRRFLMRLFRQEDNERFRNSFVGSDPARYFPVFKYMNKYIQENNIDIVQTEFFRPLFWIEGIVVPVKKVFVQHEIQFVVNQQRAHKVEKNFEDETYRIDINRNRELQQMNSYDAIITLSEDDKWKLVSSGVKTHIFPSFAKVVMRDANPIDYLSLEQVNLVFVGPENHLPNKHGLEWFLENVWAKVLSAHSELQLHIVGNWSQQTRRIWSLKYRNLIFEGFVDNLVNIMQSKILIVPIFEGSGIRMKILEAANIGVPFVGTTIGAEGLAFTSGKNCLIADDASSFTNSILSLLSDRRLLRDISVASIDHAKTSFSDTKFIQSRLSCFQYLMTM